jgi:hypothetical protein
MIQQYHSWRYTQRNETQVTPKALAHANRRRGPGTREKVRSKRVNLEGNTHVSQLPV